MLSIPLSDRPRFVNELRRLNNLAEWREVERAVNLCETLYAAGQEMDAATTKLKDKLSIRDRDQLRIIIHKLQDGERGFADEINRSVQSLADLADAADSSLEAYEESREAVRNKRDSLDARRQELINSEIRSRAVLSPKASRTFAHEEPKKKPWYKRSW